MPTEELAILLRRNQLTEEALQALHDELEARGISDIATLAKTQQSEETMVISWAISSGELLWLAGYALVFPLSTFISFWPMQSLALLITYPFLPIAWGVGIGATAMVNNDHAYLVGASLGIFFQCYVCYVAIRWLIKKIRKLA